MKAKKKNGMSRKAWAALDGERRARLQNQNPPAGAFSSKEYSIRFHLGKHAAQYELNKLVAEGILSELGRFGPTRLSYFEFSA
jgi:Fic family protein